MSCRPGLTKGLCNVVIWGALTLLLVAVLAACSSESEAVSSEASTGAVDAAIQPVTPVPQPVVMAEPAQSPPVAHTQAEPKPTSPPASTPLVVMPSPTQEPPAGPAVTPTDQSGPPTEVAPTTGLVYTDIGPDATWGDVFNRFSEEEQSCIRNEFGSVPVDPLLESPFSLENLPPLSAVAVVDCVSEESATEVALAEMSRQMGGLSEEEAVCMRELFAVIPLAKIVGAEAGEATAESALLMMSYGLGLLNCLPKLAEEAFSEAMGDGGPGIGQDGFTLEDPSFLWSYATNGWVVTAPAVVDGVVYAGSDDQSLYALTAETGELIWNHATEDVIRSTPTVVDGRVFFGSNDNHLYAVDAATGTELWKYDTGAWVQYSPAVSGGVVYLATQGDAGQAVAALDAATGESQWVADVAAPVDPTYTPAVIGSHVYVAGSTYGQFYALDAATGEVAWQAEVGGYVESAPTVLDGVVYLTVANRAYAFNESTGEIIWEVNTEEFPARDFPALVIEGVYYLAPSGNVYALDAATGEEIWSYESYMLSTAPVVDEGVLYGASQDAEYIFALDAATGEELWTQTTEDFNAYSLSVMEGILYGQLDEGYLVAADTRDGSSLWNFEAGGFSDIRVYTVAEGVIYSAGPNNSVYAHRAP